jgi:hypothetical protein
MRLEELTPAQIEKFVALGYVKLEGAFPRQAALACLEFLWQQVEKRGIRRDDPATWAQPKVVLQQSFSNADYPVFQPCSSPRLLAAIEDLVGHGRRLSRPEQWGYWPVNFAVGAGAPWEVPLRVWHFDGDHFRHFLDSPEQGLLVLCSFSEVGRHGGGTLLAEGSHHLVARLLARHPEGLALDDALALCAESDAWVADLMGRGPAWLPGASRIERFMQRTYPLDGGIGLRVVETTAAPGDVLLCHPHLLHTASQNHSGVPRFLCNRTAPLREPMSFQREDHDYSPVEIAIRRTLRREAD